MEDELTVPKQTTENILVRQEEERAKFKKKVDRIKSSIPKKNRAARARAAEDAAEEEKRMLELQASERLENNISDDIDVQRVVSNSPSQELRPMGDAGNNGIGKTETKAARRRRKKAEQEQEAQRRIEEERASMGPSSKFLEMQDIEAQLKPRNMGIHQIVADGHCLYSAVAHQMTLAQIKSTVPASVEGLRSATADYIMTRKDEFMPFIETVDGDEELFRNYCDQLRTEAVWGGQVELKAIADIIGVPIEVYAANMPVVRMGDSTSHGLILRVSFHRQYFGLGEHYNSVVPRP